MNKNIVFYIICMLFLWINPLSAQFKKKESRLDVAGKGVVYNEEKTFDFRLHTLGYAIGMNWGKIRTYYNTRYYGIAFGELRHYKEAKQRRDFGFGNTTGPISRSYVYGKQNNLFVLRGGYGEKFYLTEKDAVKGVAVGLTYEIGPAIGLLKPYYIEIGFPAPDGRATTKSIKYSEENRDAFLNQSSTSSVFGSSGLFKGIDELGFIPGGHAKFGIHFDWGAYDQYVKAVEVGFMMDVFAKKVPIMVSEENRPYFLNFYLTLQFGKRQ